MKTTIIAVTIGLTIRALVCGSIHPSQSSNKNQVSRTAFSDTATMHHGQSMANSQ